jgi:hypothetical protein
MSLSSYCVVGRAIYSIFGHSFGTCIRPAFGAPEGSLSGYLLWHTADCSLTILSAHNNEQLHISMINGNSGLADKNV